MTKYTLIITAGGTSSRYGSKNKLLEIIKDKTVIEETVNKFINFKDITQIIISANESIIAELKNLFKDYNIIEIIKGGETRQESVYNALKYVRNDYTIIHDGARPIISNETISSVLQSVVNKKAVSVMTKTTDTIKEVDNNGKIIRTIDREKLYNTQTPQAFATSIIKEAHETLKGKSFTDDSSMLEALNIPVYIVLGDSTNIKITVKSDLDFAKLYI